MTRHTHLLLSAAATCGALLTLAPNEAMACNCSPGCTDSFGVGEYLPVDARGIRWEPEYGLLSVDPDPQQVLSLDVSSATDPTYRAIPFVVDNDGYVRPEAGFEEGHTYRVSSRYDGVIDKTTREYELCWPDGVEPASTTVTIAPMPPPDGILAEASVLGRGELTYGNGGLCSEEVESVYVDVSVRLPEGFAGWTRSLDFSATVDGQPYTFRDEFSCRGRAQGTLGVDRVTARLAAQCESPGDDFTERGLTEGAHTVVIHATIPGSSFSWESEPLTVTLECLTPTEEPDVVDTSDDGPRWPDPHDQDDGCAQTPSSPVPSPWWLALMLAGVGTWTRRARRRSLW